MLAANTDLAALLHTSALAFQALKYIGVAFLPIWPGARYGRMDR
jgi:threonine/homoserine/homoserine lactone efflux protein